ncbi:MAG: hypothetical protein WA239_05845 [Candidatus Sulfotelmatobacter sp.]
MPKGYSREEEQKWNLLGSGQDSYAGQNAQDPRTSRMVQSWIVQDDGQLHRELPEPFYAVTSTTGNGTAQTLPGPIMGLYEFDQNNGQGAVNRFYFCAARVNTTITQNCLFYQMAATSTSSEWVRVSTVGTLANPPQCVTQENNFFLADGVSNWLFDGTIWVPCGIKIPLNQPAINIAVNGNPQVLISNAAFSPATGYSLPSGGVGVYLYPDSAQSANNSAGAFSLSNPLTFATATASIVSTTGSLLFNPPQYGQGFDPSIGPMEWGQFTSANGNNPTSYIALPYPANNSTSYEMVVLTQLQIPVKGTYTVQFIHDDGAFFGLGPGNNTGAIPTCSGSAENVVWQGGFPGGKTAVAAYPILFGNNISSVQNENTTVTFPEADTYALEIDYRNWNSGTPQTLLMSMVLASLPVGTTAQSNPFVTASTNGLGINSVIGRYYWYDNADQTIGVATESSSSPIGLSSGPTIDATIDVFQQPGTFNSSTTTTVVTGHNSTDNPGPVAPELTGDMVGKYFYLGGALIGTIATIGATSTLNMTAVTAPKQVTLANGTVVYEATYSFNYVGQTTPGAPLVSTTSTQISPGANNALAGTIWTINGFANSSNNLQGAVALSSSTNLVTFNNANSVAETHAATATSPANTAYLTAVALHTVNTGRAVICDPRCTHWNIYASESDGSQIGEYLFSVPVTTTLYADSSPFLDSPSNTFLPINRPLRNDPPVASKILTVHKVRQFRRQESSPNFFAFTANEEVTAGNNGDPAQCLPGASINTVSDMVNIVSFPDQSARLRALISHMDALYMFSEKQCYPLYGQSVDDFAISQMVTFALGAAGRFAGVSTPNGLVFMSYDKRAFLYPTSLYSTYLAQGGAAQSALTEIGKPLRNVFSQIPSTRLDEVVSVHYHFGVRDWWVISFPTSVNSDVPQTWVWDFMGKSWFQLQRGFCSLQVFEVSEGALVLIGGGADGNTYVVDDQTGTYYTVNNQNYTVSPSLGNLPMATWRPALINFGNEEIGHIFRRLELEFSSEALAQDVSITAWFDPLLVDQPGQGKTMHLRPALGAGRYSAMLAEPGSGAVCQRMLLQIQVRASANTGVIRGVKLYANPAPGFITGANRPGGV